MTIIPGNCVLTEAEEQALVFALCVRRGADELAPISMPGDPSPVGVISQKNGRQLTLRLGRLDPNVTRILIGLAVPQGHDLTERMFRLRATHDDGQSSAELFVPNVKGNRYAIMAMIVKDISAGHRVWKLVRVPTTEFFESRRAISQLYSVPEWWTQRA